MPTPAPSPGGGHPEGTMKRHMLKLLATFDYHSATDFVLSMMPSRKYNLAVITMIINFAFIPFEKIFGLDGMALVALGVVFFAELSSGMIAAHIRGEAISSIKLSRFTFKVAYYLVLIFVPYTFYQSFQASHKDMAAALFDWLHMFLVIQIVFENLISIIENMAVISGKDKTAWISKIQDAVNNLFNKQA